MLSYKEFMELAEAEREELFQNLNRKSGSRKREVLALIEEATEGIEICEIAQLLNIKEKNVSSQLTYLRKEGKKIMEVGTGRGKKLMSEDHFMKKMGYSKKAK